MSRRVPNAAMAVVLRMSVAIVLAGLAAGAAVGCAERPRREVVVRERVLMVQPTSPAQAPGDVVLSAEPRPASASFNAGSAPPPPPPPSSAAAAAAAAAAASTAPAAEVVAERATYFYDDLVPYGQWIEVVDYGPVWQPYDIPPGWRPYTVGHWEYTDDAGWLWLSDEPFGWCCYHYGRWAFVTGYGWCWVPGTEWAAAWVVWRSGGGYVGWAAMPPGPAVGVSVSVGVEIGEPPAFAFCFVEERYLTDVNLRERILPVTRNVTLIKHTTNLTRYEVVNGRVVNRGVDVREVERATGRPIPRRRLVDVTDPRAVGLRGNDVRVYRPRGAARRPGGGAAREPGNAREPAGAREPGNARPEPSGAREPANAREPAGPREPPAARQAAVPAREAVPARFVEAAPPRPQTAVQIEAERRQLEDFHRTLLAEMEQRHARELRLAPPAGPQREALLAQQMLERRAFENQRRLELESWQHRPVRLRRERAPPPR